MGLERWCRRRRCTLLQSDRKYTSSRYDITTMELRHYDHIHTNAHGMEQGGLGLHLYELGTGNWNLGIGNLGLDTED
jgi:hypothetical protein